MLIFFRTVECLKCKQLLREISEHYGQYQEKEAEVLAISTDEKDRLRQLAQDLALPFPLLSDSDRKVTNLYLKHMELGGDRAALEAAIFVADRWGAIFSTRSIEKAQDLPAEAEIRDWLEFIDASPSSTALMTRIPKPLSGGSTGRDGADDGDEICITVIEIPGCICRLI